MSELILIALPIFIVLFGLVGVMSFASPPPMEGEQTLPAQPRPAEEATTAMVFVQHPEGWVTAGHDLPMDQVLLSIEEHLRQENQAAAAFARNPSTSNLWMH